MSKKYKAILFDLDGTLLDTSADLTSAYNKALSQYTSHSFSIDETRKYAGYGSKKLYEHALENKIKPDCYEKFRQQFIDEYANQQHANTLFFPGIETLLATLDQQIIPWGIVTNKPYRGALDVVNSFAILKNAQTVIGADSAAYPKPDAAPLLLACAELDLATSDCLFVGDTVTDIEAAKRAKMDVAAVDFGFGFDDIKTSQWQPNYWINKPEQLLKFVIERDK
jgi:N-acetyl-D-muramate 6-phosphate phosphatase